MVPEHPIRQDHLRHTTGFALALGFDDESSQFNYLTVAKAPDLIVRVMSRLPGFVLHHKGVLPVCVLHHVLPVFIR